MIKQRGTAVAISVGALAFVSFVACDTADNSAPNVALDAAFEGSVVVQDGATNDDAGALGCKPGEKPSAAALKAGLLIAQGWHYEGTSKNGVVTTSETTDCERHEGFHIHGIVSAGFSPNAPTDPKDQDDTACAIDHGVELPVGGFGTTGGEACRQIPCSDADTRLLWDANTETGLEFQYLPNGVRSLIAHVAIVEGKYLVVGQLNGQNGAAYGAGGGAFSCLKTETPDGG